MFEQFSKGPRKGFENYTAISLCVHAGVVFFVVGLAAIRARQPAHKQVEVSFMGPGKSKGAPPPPPPPAGKKHVTPKRKLAKTEIPKPSLVAPKIDPPEAVKEPEVEDEGVEGGVPGGVAGGVVGGVLGGQLGSTGGGGEEQPVDKPKPKNVPPFVIQRDVIQQTRIHLSEVFKNSHRSSGVMNGMYKVCVGTDGHVYEVEAVKSVPGADEDIIEGMKEGWLYKPQQVPVCFLYNVPIDISQ